jgi:hypothetical protein
MEMLLLYCRNHKQKNLGNIAAAAAAVQEER